MKKSKTGKISSISKVKTYEEMGEFWDNHEFTEFQDQVHEVKMDVDIQVRHHYVSLDPHLMLEMGKEAASKGLSTQSLVNLVIKEHLAGQRK